MDDTPRDSWQQLQLDIDLKNDTYDLFWGANRGESELVAPYAEFRSGEQDFLDRFTVAFFSGRNFPEGNAYLDNLNIEILTKDWLGDANLDGEFNSGDLVDVFTANLYETGSIAAWSQGDWNGDRVFNSGDFVAAFQGGGYEQGKRKLVTVVPEPDFGALAFCGFFALVASRARRLRRVATGRLRL